MVVPAAVPVAAPVAALVAFAVPVAAAAGLKVAKQVAKQGVALLTLVVQKLVLRLMRSQHVVLLIMASGACVTLQIVV